GFFVSVEFALVKVRTTKIRELAEAGSWRAKVAKNILENLTAYLSATQLGVTVASLGLGYVGEPAVEAILDQPFQALGLHGSVVHALAFAIAFATITFVHIVLGELAPKAMALRK